MALLNIVKKIFGNNSNTSNNSNIKTFDISYDGEVNFSIDPKILKNIQKGTENSVLTSQYIVLKMLVEQEEAKTLPDGFCLSPEVTIQLDEETRQSLCLPNVWNGTIKAEIKGETRSARFSVDFEVENNGTFTSIYQLDFPRIKVGSTWYLLSPSQFLAFSALLLHKKSTRQEYDNLLLIYQLQKAKNDGCKIELSHFETFSLKTPQNITVQAELDESGNLLLTPNVGQEANCETMKSVLGQLQKDTTHSLRVGNEIILFDNDKLKAVQEVISNRVIHKEEVATFLKNPSAYLNAQLIDLDTGFSIRVRGITEFRHAYFGDTDYQSMDWFGKESNQSDILPINKISAIIESKEQLTELDTLINNASKTGSMLISYEGNTYDISNKNMVVQTKDKIKEKLLKKENEKTEDLSSKPNKNEKTLTIDIDLNDEDIEKPSPIIEQYLEEICYTGELNWDNYYYKPYPHQEKGVRWGLGLLQSPPEIKEYNGALLADDMGLGKTFMALSIVDNYYRIINTNKIDKPTLVVAPLSLLENWKDEIKKVFKKSPFESIVILQSNADLKQFQVGKAEIHQNTQNVEHIRYSLKVGKNYAHERLDMPKRLVLTTYQTLRDYQFSLCSIDWGVIIFDEAQNIKNPNTLQTRAAKGLKSEFKLLATGTPVENSLADFWCLMDTARPTLLGSYQEFRQKYIKPITDSQSHEEDSIRIKVGRKLREAVGIFMLRRIKEDNLQGLPEKNLYVGTKCNYWKYLPSIESTMKGIQKDIYDNIINQQNEGENEVVLTALHHLRDCSLHPKLVDKKQLSISKNNNFISLCKQSGKLESLLNLLTEIKAKEEKCIIFIVNKRLQAFLSQELGKYFGLGILDIINGDTKAVATNKNTATRKSIIEDFENKKGFNIIIMSPIAAGVGLTVVGANHVIHLERHWNPAKEAQATDRVYRIGQTKPVHIYVPILKHPEIESFDQNLHKLLANKTQLKDVVITPTQVSPTLPNPVNLQKSIKG